MGRRILLVHSSRSTRSLLRSHILSEATDEVAFDEAATLAEAVQKLRVERYDVAITDDCLEGMDGAKVVEHARSGPSRECAIVVVLPTGAHKERKVQLGAAGVSQVIFPPFSSSDLIACVDAACDPKKKRVHARVVIPGTKARIRLKSSELVGDVVNASISGVAAEVVYDDRNGDFLKPARIHLEFPAFLGGYKTGEIRASIVRVQVRSWTSELAPERMQGAWIFHDVPSSILGPLGILLERAAKAERPPQGDQE